MTYIPPAPDDLRAMQASEQLACLSAIDGAILAAKNELEALDVVKMTALADKEAAEQALTTAKGAVRDAKAAYDKQVRLIGTLGHLSRHIKTLLRHQ